MTGEQSFFLSLLRDFSSDSLSPLPETLPDWDQLYALADDQSMLGICYRQLRELAGEGLAIPAEVLERFHRGFYSEVYFAANRSAAMEELEASFRKEGIEFVPFKGWVAKEYWPVPELRTMGDIDILIRTGDRQRTDSIMTALGYERYVDNQAVWTYNAKDLSFELHDHMFYEKLHNTVDYIGYFDRAWDYASPDLDESFHFVFLLAHLAKHTVNNGHGFRGYLDLVFFCREAGARLRWDWIRENLKELGLLRFAETCIALCRAWFDFESPFPVGELDEGFYAFATNKLFRDGIFGLENEQNASSFAAREISRSQGPYFLGALGLTLRRIFPPYRDLQLIPWYSFVDGRPWLTPAAWVYRWYYCLAHKRAHSERLLSEPFVRRDVIEKRNQQIRDWGL